MSEKDDDARKLAEAHYQIESGITQIFRITGGADVELKIDEPIKLLEINESTFPSGIMPLHFGPAPDIGVNFPSVIVEVTPLEYEQIRAKALTLPSGWQIGPSIPKPPVAKQIATSAT